MVIVNKKANLRSTALIQGLRAGDEAAAQAVVDEYMPLLIRAALYALRGAQREVSDEEDVVQSALGSFFRAATSGRFAELANRADLKRLLLRMTVRKAIDLIRRQKAIKKGGGRIRQESVLRAYPAADCLFNSMANGQATPDVEAVMQESFQLLLEKLDDSELKEIALAKLDGLENTEIAGELNCSLRTIERRLKLIRKIWCLEAEELNA